MKFLRKILGSDNKSNDVDSSKKSGLLFSIKDYRGKIIVDDDLPYYLFIKKKTKKAGLLVLNDDLTAEFKELPSDVNSTILENENLLKYSNKELKDKDFIEFCYNEVYSEKPTFKFLASEFDMEEDELDHVEEILEYAEKTMQEKSVRK